MSAPTSSASAFGEGDNSIAVHITPLVADPQAGIIRVFTRQGFCHLWLEERATWKKIVHDP